MHGPASVMSEPVPARGPDGSQIQERLRGLCSKGPNAWSARRPAAAVLRGPDAQAISRRVAKTSLRVQRHGTLTGVFNPVHSKSLPDNSTSAST